MKINPMYSILNCIKSVGGSYLMGPINEKGSILVYSVCYIT